MWEKDKGDEMSEEIEIMRAAIRKNGKAMQTVVAIEEMSELQKELTKYIRGKGNRENLIEEVADVLVMITQIQLMYALPDDEVERIMRLKLNRLKERMEQNG
jgi:NTP pyrophosphatase (non-canonical NTP hydrolase)